MYKYACSLGLTIAYRTNEDVRLLIKMSIALALLPPERAQEGYEVSKCFIEWLYLYYPL